jgi:hypothetical protein
MTIGFDRTSEPASGGLLWERREPRWDTSDVFSRGSRRSHGSDADDAALSLSQNTDGRDAGNKKPAADRRGLFTRRAMARRGIQCILRHDDACETTLNLGFKWGRSVSIGLSAAWRTCTPGFHRVSAVVIKGQGECLRAVDHSRGYVISIGAHARIASAVGRFRRDERHESTSGCRCEIRCREIRDGDALTEPNERRKVYSAPSASSLRFISRSACEIS